MVVLQTPMSVSQSNLLGQLVLTHVPDKTQSFVEKHIGSDYEIASKSLEVTRSLSVILCGRLQNPVLMC